MKLEERTARYNEGTKKTIARIITKNPVLQIYSSETEEYHYLSLDQNYSIKMYSNAELSNEIKNDHTSIDFQKIKNISEELAIELLFATIVKITGFEGPDNVIKNFARMSISIIPYIY